MSEHEPERSRGSWGEDSHRLYELAAGNRARLESAERELERVRDAMHSVRAEVQAIRFLAERVAELAEDVRHLADRVERVAAHALSRPSTSALGVLGQYVGLAVAIIALILASHR